MSWLVLTLAISTLVLGQTVLAMRAHISRLEQRVGEDWANDFTAGVLSHSVWIEEAFGRWTRGSEVPGHETERVIDYLFRQEMILNRVLGQYSQAYPRKELVVPRAYLAYVQRVREELVMRSRYQATWVLTEDDRAVLVRYHQDFREIVSLITEHFPGWGTAPDWGADFWGARFVSNRQWPALVGALEGWARGRGYRLE